MTLTFYLYCEELGIDIPIEVDIEGTFYPAEWSTGYPASVEISDVSYKFDDGVSLKMRLHLKNAIEHIVNYSVSDIEDMLMKNAKKRAEL